MLEANHDAGELTRAQDCKELTLSPLDLIQKMRKYQRKCEAQGNYKEARKAREKCVELKNHEEKRQLKYLADMQTRERAEMESLQKQQYIDFCSEWERYIADYESTAYMSLERLKEKQAKDVTEVHARLLAPDVSSWKASPDLLELRKKEQNLARQCRYKEAQRVQAEADEMERWERTRNVQEDEARATKAATKYREKQEKTLLALLRRIQKDRREQKKQKAEDSQVGLPSSLPPVSAQKLLARNKNLMSDLLHKQKLEMRRASEALKLMLTQPEEAQKRLRLERSVLLEKRSLSDALTLVGHLEKVLRNSSETYEDSGLVLSKSPA